MDEKLHSSHVKQHYEKTRSPKSTSSSSKKKPVKVVYISNPMKIKASPSEFRAVVQQHTGRYASSSPPTPPPPPHDQQLLARGLLFKKDHEYQKNEEAAADQQQMKWRLQLMKRSTSVDAQCTSGPDHANYYSAGDDQIMNDHHLIVTTPQMQLLDHEEDFSPLIFP